MMDDIDKIMKDYQKDIDDQLFKNNHSMKNRLEKMRKEVERHKRLTKEVTDKANRRMYKEFNAEQEWTVRRIVLPKKCMSTGETIKPFQVAYFKDWFDRDGRRQRDWLSEAAYTWEALKDNA